MLLLEKQSMHANLFYSVLEGTDQPEGTLIGLRASDENLHSS